MAYIEKEPLCAWLENMGVSDLIIHRIKSEVHFPSADVVEVVRCNDCKNLVGYDNCCMYFGHKVDDNDFCSYGERK